MRTLVVGGLRGMGLCATKALLKLDRATDIHVVASYQLRVDNWQNEPEIKHVHKTSELVKLKQKPLEAKAWHVWDAIISPRFWDLPEVMQLMADPHANLLVTVINSEMLTFMHLDKSAPFERVVVLPKPESSLLSTLAHSLQLDLPQLNSRVKALKDHFFLQIHPDIVELEVPEAFRLPVPQKMQVDDEVATMSEKAMRGPLDPTKLQIVPPTCTPSVTAQPKVQPPAEPSAKPTSEFGSPIQFSWRPTHVAQAAAVRESVLRNLSVPLVKPLLSPENSQHLVNADGSETYTVHAKGSASEFVTLYILHLLKAFREQLHMTTACVHV